MNENDKPAFVIPLKNGNVKFTSQDIAFIQREHPFVSMKKVMRCVQYHCELFPPSYKNDVVTMIFDEIENHEKFIIQEGLEVYNNV